MSDKLRGGTTIGGYLALHTGNLENKIDSDAYVDGSIDREHLAPDVIDGTKIADDSINSEHYVANSIEAKHLNVSGNGTTAQYLRSDGDGSFTWATPTDTVYTHPSHPGDDITLDTGPLSGATVISDLDFNITTDTLGHVTDANATYSTRNLTAGDIGAATASHTHSYLPLTGGTMTGTITAPTFSGSGASLTSLNASNLSSGIVPDARITGSYTGMTNLTGSGTVDFAKFLGNASDTVSAPSFSWTGDTNTGIYSPGADQLAITTGGVQRALFNSSGITGTLVGNANTATKLATARTINGVSFDGTANITVSDSTAVNLTGNQTIAGVKTFSSSPIVPTPTTGTQVANKDYVDANAGISLTTANSYDLGVGQTWQDMTSSRSTGVTYTNTTGKPISVLIGWNGTTNQMLSATLNGLTIDNLGGTYNVHSVYVRDNVSIIVPNGNTYIITSTGGTLVKWLELR